MSTSSHREIPEIHYAVDRTGLESAGRESEVATSAQGDPGAGWAPVVVGALLLHLFIVVAVMWGGAWLVLVAPAVLIGLARYMGLRSLWPSASRQSSGRGRVSVKEWERRDTYRLGRTNGRTRLPLYSGLWFEK